MRWRGIIIIIRRCEQCATQQPAMLSVNCSMGIVYEIVYRIFYLNHCSDLVSACRRRRKSISCLILYRSRRNQYYYIISVMYILYELQTITIELTIPHIDTTKGTMTTVNPQDIHIFQYLIVSSRFFLIYCQTFKLPESTPHTIHYYYYYLSRLCIV